MNELANRFGRFYTVMYYGDKIKFPFIKNDLTYQSKFFIGTGDYKNFIWSYNLYYTGVEIRDRNSR